MGGYKNHTTSPLSCSLSIWTKSRLEAFRKEVETWADLVIWPGMRLFRKDGSVHALSTPPCPGSHHFTLLAPEGGRRYSGSWWTIQEMGSERCSNLPWSLCRQSMKPMPGPLWKEGACSQSQALPSSACLVVRFLLHSSPRTNVAVSSSKLPQLHKIKTVRG